MKNEFPPIQQLLANIELEENEQAKRFQLDEHHSLKQLKADGLALHPIRITRKSFGYADYPELSFRLPFPTDAQAFRSGAAIECFCQGEEPVKGMFLALDGKQGEFRLFAPDFPDWIEDDGVGIKLTPDTRTSSLMKKAVAEIPTNPRLLKLFETIHGTATHTASHPTIPKQTTSFFNTHLNHSQQVAVNALLENEDVLLVHGPPGTGKTTTLIEAILQLVKKGEKVLVSAPSNTAVDHLAESLIGTHANFIRVGNNTKVNARIFPYTPEGKLKEGKQEKEIKKLKIRAEEMRKMAFQYKRRFGKDERDQKKLLLNEVKSIRKQIKDIQAYNEEMLYTAANVVLGTPIGLLSEALQGFQFQTLIIDEAGQCLEPLAWCIFPLADKLVLAGDHLQLPPTVLSEKAARNGFNVSILERFFGKISNIHLLDTQYRMRAAIAQFSNRYFYEGKLVTPTHLDNEGEHVFFYDTAGAGYEEESGADGSSLVNRGELEMVQQISEHLNLDVAKTVFISPYAAQVALAKEMLPAELRVSTIDSFQGQEAHTIIISLVRCNANNEIGFLKDYRRMNVAMTRAQQQLIIIGDSATLATDRYFDAFLNFIEELGGYKSCWELG